MIPPSLRDTLPRTRLAWLPYILAPLLLTWLVLFLKPDLSDINPVDWERAWYPPRTLPTDGSMELEGAWNASTPKADAAVKVQTAKGPWRSLQIMLNGSEATPWIVRITRGNDSLTRLKVEPGKLLVVEGDQLPGIASSEIPLAIRIAPQGDSSHHLERIGVRTSILNTTERPRSIAGMICVGLFPIAFTFFLSTTGRRAWERAAPVSGMIGIAAAFFAGKRPELLDYAGFVTLAFVIAGVGGAIHQWYQTRTDPNVTAHWLRRIELGFLGAILIAGLLVRWEQFVIERNAPLGDDAHGYVQIALHRGLYDTAQSHGPWVREPLFPAMLRSWFAVAPDTHTSARLFSMLLGILPVGAIWLAGRRFFSPIVGLIAAGFYALNTFLAHESVEVLREDFGTAMLASLAWTLAEFSKPIPGLSRWIAPVVVGKVLVSLVLLRISNLLLLPPILLWLFGIARWRWVSLAILTALVVVPLVPHLLFNRNYSGGDPFFSSTVHVRYYLNRDFMGQPGFPATREEYDANPYAGEPVSTAKMYSFYSPLEIARRYVVGYVNIFIAKFPQGFLFAGHELPMAFGLIGGVVLLRRWKTHWWLVLLYVIAAFPIAFIAAKPFDVRLAMPNAPLTLWVWALGVEVVACWALARLSKGTWLSVRAAR